MDALGGEPGVYSARYAGEGAGDDANNGLAARTIARPANRSARFVCVIALAHRGKLRPDLPRFRGRSNLSDAPRGSNGFGYDPLFLLSAVRLHVRRSAARPQRWASVTARGL